ncbi:MAG: tetratricopeptide repeat protein [Elusimicrobia bacterium]|nr:tetratricopeptide repeat protein [Elusimicrobiota bacterium]
MSIVAAAVIFSTWARAYDTIQFLPPLPTQPSLKPAAVAASSDRIYVLDQEKGQLGVFALDGKPLAQAGRSGKESNAFSGPKGIALGADGTVFVADTGNSRIQLLDAEGKFLGRFGTDGSGPGQLDAPESVAVGGDGRVYVADTGNDRVQVFTREGVFLFGLGGKGSEPGSLNEPTQVQVDAADNIYVLDEGNSRVQKFNSRLQFVREIPRLGVAMALDPYGFLYMLDAKRSKVKEVNPEGSPLGEFGSVGSGLGQFKKPRGLAVAPDGTVLVADWGNGRICRAQVANKMKTARVPQSLAMKLLVSGPASVYPYPASALASSGGLIYAYLSKAGQFVALDEEGKERVRFGRKQGKDPSVTKGTRGLAVSEALGIYVADTESDRLQVFTATGGFKAEIGSGGVFGKGKEGRLSEPSAVAINDKGTVYVADTGNRRISAFSPDGAFLFAFDKIGPHQLEQPTAVVYDEANFLFVLDRKLKKVFKCEPSGGYLSAWGEAGERVGQFKDPVAMAYDGKSYLYVLDQGSPRVSVFDKDGNWVTNFFAPGMDERSLKEPAAVAVSGARLVVADPAQNRILTFKLRPQIAPPAAVSTKAVAAQVFLEWPEQKDPWIELYRVYRAAVSTGPYAEAGVVGAGASVFKDTDVAGPQTYFYRVAAQASTGDRGPLSPPLSVFVQASFNRAAIEISSITIGNIFAANYKWYLKNPIGKAELRNNTNLPFQNVKLSFQLKDFMDYSTDKVIPNLRPQEKIELPLDAALNNRILEVTEDTPIQAEFKVTYFEDGKPMAFSRNQPLRVYSRNAITWDDPRRIANFITPKDPPVLMTARRALEKPPKGPPAAQYLNRNLVTALHLWDALGALGVRFLSSPNNPFEKMSEDPAFPVDYTQFPRETLKRKSGQCDDLSTLFISMLEAASVRAVVLDYPGHMAMMFDTGAADPMEAGLPGDELIKYEGTLWAPVEVTMVGSPFQDAARKAIFAYKEMLAQGKASVIDPRVAWQTYEMATLPEAKEDAVPAIPEEDAAVRFDGEIKVYLKGRFDYLAKKLEARIAKDPKDVDSINALGVVCFQHGKLDEADKMFAKALEAEPGNAGALNNIGNLAFLASRYEEAMSSYLKAAEADPSDGGIWMNLAAAALGAKQREKAEEFVKKAVEADPSLKAPAQELLK